jgi:hypothetical protein
MDRATASSLRSALAVHTQTSWETCVVTTYRLPPTSAARSLTSTSRGCSELRGVFVRLPFGHHLQCRHLKRPIDPIDSIPPVVSENSLAGRFSIIEAEHSSKPLAALYSTPTLIGSSEHFSRRLFSPDDHALRDSAPRSASAPAAVVSCIVIGIGQAASRLIAEDRNFPHVGRKFRIDHHDKSLGQPSIICSLKAKARRAHPQRLWKHPLQNLRQSTHQHVRPR